MEASSWPEQLRKGGGGGRRGGRGEGRGKFKTFNRALPNMLLALFVRCF